MHVSDISRQKPLYGRSLYGGRVYIYSHTHKVPFPLNFVITIILTLILFYQPEEYPTLDQILDKSVQCFLCLVVTILNSERELT